MNFKCLYFEYLIFVSDIVITINIYITKYYKIYSYWCPTSVIEVLYLPNGAFALIGLVPSSGGPMPLSLAAITLNKYS